MRILILSQYYYPEPVEKVHDLARGLVQLGHEVQVITGFPCYPKGEIYPGYRQTMSFQEDIEGVQVTRIPQHPDHSNSAIRRALYYFSFAFSAATLGLLKAHRADVLLVYMAAMPVGLAGWVISRLRRMLLVLDVVDIWPESVVASGMLKNDLIIEMLRRVACFIYRKADHINVVTEGFKRNITSLGIPDDKISVIHNWMPESTYRRVKPDPELAKKEGLDNRFNIMYAGSMGPFQNLSIVLSTASLLTDLPDVQFVLIGDGLEYSALVKQAQSENLSNVRFLGRRPPELMSTYYAFASALLVHLKPDLLSDVSIPSKTFAYMASGRPVIMAVKGDAEEFIKANGFGLAVEPSNPEKLAEAVRILYEMPVETREAMGEAGFFVYNEKFRSLVQIRKVSDLLVAVTQHPT